MTYVNPLFDRLLKPAHDNNWPSPTSLTTSEAAIEYNGFKFPPAVKTSARVEPVPDASNRATKYLRLRIRVSFYLFHGLNMGSNHAGANNLYSGTFNRNNHVPTSVQDADYTTDEEMNNLRLRLTQPGQKLKFTSLGLGTVVVQDGTTLRKDVDNGPRPQITTWRPLTNKMCFVEWEVVANVPPCEPGGGFGSYAGFSYRADFSISREGLTVRTISGSLEIPLSRVPNNSATEASGSDNFDVATIRNDIVAFFPLIPRFSRTQNYQLSEDRKYINFTITDTEINSSDAYGEGIAYADVKLSAGNSKQFVFSKFDVTLSGTIHLLAGYPKSYALAEISRIFTKVFVDSNTLGSKFIEESASASDSEHQTGQPGSLLAEKTNKSIAYLTNVSFTDDIFGRSISFSIRWWLFTTLETLFNATGMFVPIRDQPGDSFATNQARQEAAWTTWAASAGTILDSGGLADLTLNQDDDVIVTLCNPLPTGTAAAAGVPDDVSEPPAEFPPGERLAYDSWMHYDSQFNLEVYENAMFHAMLGDYAGAVETIATANASRTNTTYTAPGIPASPDANQTHLQHNRREPTYFLQHMGSAIRLNYPVPVPKVEKAYGHSVKRVGVTNANSRYLGTAINVTTGESHKVFGLFWHITYALPGPPLNSTIKTDAHQDVYS